MRLLLFALALCCFAQDTKLQLRHAREQSHADSKWVKQYEKLKAAPKTAHAEASRRDAELGAYIQSRAAQCESHQLVPDNYGDPIICRKPDSPSPRPAKSEPAKPEPAKPQD